VYGLCHNPVSFCANDGIFLLTLQIYWYDFGILKKCFNFVPNNRLWKEILCFQHFLGWYSSISKIVTDLFSWPEFGIPLRFRGVFSFFFI